MHRLYFIGEVQKVTFGNRRAACLTLTESALTASFLPPIAQALIAIVAGIALLVWSADRFVAGAAALAKNLGMSPMLIGLTIVSLGTSAPEVLVSVQAALMGTGSIAMGNAIGSNIANIGLVLGCTALIAAIPVQRHLLTVEIPVLLAVTALAGFFLADATISRLEGWILLLVLPPVLWFLARSKRRENTEDESPKLPEISTAASAFWFAIGLGLLIVAAKILVWGAVFTAQYFSVSPLIIGLTVLAVGTSLPELAASVVSACKGHHDIALGNVIGSNIFNLLAVMSLPAVLAPLHAESAVFSRDFAAMAILTLALSLAIALPLLVKKAGKTATIGRLTGAGLLLLYAAYIGLLFFNP